MQLEKLTISNFGLFAGEQSFELTPRSRNGVSRPIIMFGGLNGAGKTTILTAIRLVLYGRTSVDSTTTQNQYDNILREYVHRPQSGTVAAQDAYISLEFTYARLGNKVRYCVTRAWNSHGKGANESLKVDLGNDRTEYLSGEQAQAFLNQLIPGGISQFFFFDGEKIAALARDDSDVVLADAIRRLLGLDIADRLGGDLAAFLRQSRTENAALDVRKKIVSLETEIKLLEEECASDLKKLEFEIEPSLDAIKQRYEQRKSELIDRGGAWAVNRSELEGNLEKIREQKREFEDELREQLSGSAIFSLAPSLCAQVAAGLEQYQLVSERKLLAKVIHEQAGVLKARLVTADGLKAQQKLIASCIDAWASEVAAKHDPQQDTDYGITSTEARNIITSLTVSAPLLNRAMSQTSANLKKAIKEEDIVLQQLAHAPSEESLRDAFEALTAAASEIARFQEARRKFIDQMRSKVWAQVDLTRKLRKLIEIAERTSADSRSDDTAISLQKMMVEYRTAASEEKCKSLRQYFLRAFTRLTRKEKVINDVHIDPITYSVILQAEDGTKIPKYRLSAGEKQIYAIAMLEALAKASGRHLPVIIDTPLGRLDSKHRHRLVESYFPTASHQVIILSTDTEIDQSFYQGLAQYISHGYHLSFDESLGATRANEGYFWDEAGGENSYAT
ncbi:DNA sulfur modification protein DndD [Oxalobacteraceae sp. CFBP 8763]|nr:DNA sulfur modification protein DndD [Oxalobacteraceae sp. CFBP 8763]